MDEHDTIPRREAILGLGLLGALSIALVATIMYRIVHSAPRNAPPVSAPTWAAAPAIVPEPATATAAPIVQTHAPATGDRYAGHPFATALPPAAAIPTTGDGSSSVPATSLAPALMPVDQAPTMAEPPLAEPPLAEPQQPEFVRPRFVAPSSR